MKAAVIMRGAGDNISYAGIGVPDPGEDPTVPFWAGGVAQADSLVDAMGINVGDSHYYSADQQAVADRIAWIGFRHVRFPRTNVGGSGAHQRAMAATCHAAGMRGMGQADDAGTITVVSRVREMFGQYNGGGWPVGFCDGVSASNEPNPSSPAAWAVTTPADDPNRLQTAPVSLNQLKREVTEAWNAVQLYAPDPSIMKVRPPAPASRGNSGWWARLALVNSWGAVSNQDDIHAYQAGGGPEGNSTLAYREACRVANLGGAPRDAIVTECGVHNKMGTDSTHKPTPEDVAAYQLPRYPFELIDPFDINRLFSRMYFFQLYNEVDEGLELNPNGSLNTGDHEAGFGFFRDDKVTPKLHATAMRNLITRFNDPGASHTTTAPRLRVDNLDVNLMRRLYQKRNGTYILALHRKNVTGWSPAQWTKADWKLTPSGNDNPAGSAGYVTIPAAINVTVTFGSERPVTVYTPSIQAAATTATQTAAGVTVSLREHVVLVEFSAP